MLAAEFLEPQHLHETGNEAEPDAVAIPVSKVIAMLGEGAGRNAVGVNDRGT